MIRYIDVKKVTHKIKIKRDINDVTHLRLLDMNIIEIPDLKEFYRLQFLDLSGNQIEEIKGLDKLTSLRQLKLPCNQIEEIKGLDKLINLYYLDLSYNRIKEIKGLYQLKFLQTLGLSNNQIKEIKGLDGLISLQVLDLSYNQIEEIKGLDGLTSLQNLHLTHNKIKEIKGLDELTSLQHLYLSYNKIKEIKGIYGLTSLEIIDLYKNQITHIPFTIMSLRHLESFRIDCKINGIIRRFLDKNRIKNNKTIYDDSQNVHDSNIVKSIKDSIYNIISESKSVSFENISKEIIDDEILTNKTKSQLIEYCEDKTVHSLLNLTFEEVLCSVWKVLIEHKENNEIKKILNEEMKDSMCKCFTGRLSRLINCLNGFDDRVSIKISDKSQILNVIINVRNKYIDDVSKQKEKVIKELTERGFDEEIINEYIVYLE